MAGMIAANALRGDAPLAHWQQLADLNGGLLLDVRSVDEFADGSVEGAVNIPLSQLRDRLHELNPDQEIWVYCQVGQRAYYAARVLRLNGFNAHNLSGGFKTYRTVASDCNGNLNVGRAGYHPGDMQQNNIPGDRVSTSLSPRTLRVERSRSPVTGTLLIGKSLNFAELASAFGDAKDIGEVGEVDGLHDFGEVGSRE